MLPCCYPIVFAFKWNSQSTCNSRRTTEINGLCKGETLKVETMLLTKATFLPTLYA